MFHIDSLIFAEERMDRNLNVCLSESQGRRIYNRSTTISAYTSNFS